MSRDHLGGHPAPDVTVADIPNPPAGPGPGSIDHPQPEPPVDLHQETWIWVIQREGRRYVVSHGPMESEYRFCTYRGARRWVDRQIARRQQDGIVWQETR
jgi:hypothetical protein